METMLLMVMIPLVSFITFISCKINDSLLKRTVSGYSNILKSLPNTLLFIGICLSITIIINVPLTEEMLYKAFFCTVGYRVLIILYTLIKTR